MATQSKCRRTLWVCYLGFVTQAICANFVPLLFVTFYRSRGIGFERLALISSCFFVTQLVTDAFCAKVVDKLGYRACIVVAEVAFGLGLLGLAFIPDLVSDPFIGLRICSMIYAVGSGLTEVLASPIVEACLFENKTSMMSLLHSFYCWGSVGLVCS
ncbi:hypothetical protein QP232_06540 [Alloscardovia omnicolens]|nr:MFS transporter [Alloscardovia omnicolens]MDK6664126.1 hypothetical protein [Alloscardovia omnicolens]MDK7748471.1 hypothetical protein [Alloscardovia omnicolens]